MRTTDTEDTTHTHECRDCGGSIYCFAEDERDCKEPICSECDLADYLANANTADPRRAL